MVVASLRRMSRRVKDGRGACRAGDHRNRDHCLRRWRQRTPRRLQRPHRGPDRATARGLRRGVGGRHRRPLRRLRQPRTAHRRGGRPHARRRLHLPEPRRGRLPGREGRLDPARRGGSTWCPRATRPATGGSGCRARVRMLVYNTDLVDPAELPDSVLDLTAPEFAGRWPSRPQRLVPGLRDRHARPARGRGGPSLARGHGGGRPAHVRQQHRHRRGRRPGRGADGARQPLLRLPGAGRGPRPRPSRTTSSPRATSARRCWSPRRRSSRAPARDDDAEALVEFLLSTERRSTSATRRSSTRWPGRRAGPELPPFEEISTTRVDLDELGGGLERTTELIDESGLNS